MGMVNCGVVAAMLDRHYHTLREGNAPACLGGKLGQFRCMRIFDEAHSEILLS